MSRPDRLHALDAVRAFALLLGVAFHAGFSFIPGMIPGVWAIVDTSPSTTISVLLFTAHVFRMSLFFLMAGFFARMLFQRRGARGFWLDRLKRILVPLVVGWLVLAPSLLGVWLWGLSKTFGGTLPAAPPSMPPPPPGAFPLTHLWFLYYLLVLYVAVAAGRALVVALDRSGTIRRAADRVTGGLVRTGAAAVVLPLPLVAALAVRTDWVMWFGIPTPDQSVIPQIASLVGYGTAVAFGWLLHRQTDLLATWAKSWPFHLAGAMAATAACLAIAGVVPTFAPAPRGGATLAFAAAYGVAIWCWSFAAIGLAVRFLAGENARIRYVADASYWIYLAHLPVVVVFQILAGHLPLHWTVKFPAILAASLVVLFGSYHYLVRSTFIGQVLNGRRYPRGVPSAPSAAAPAPVSTRAPDPAPAADSPVMARLAGVHKRYGRTVALAGLDLDVRRGELLAVLGPNGAGKSTAIALWLGLLEPDQGTARLLDRSPLEIDGRRHVGVMMQDVALTPELRVRELITQTASYYPAPLGVAETLALTGLDGLADRRYGKLSGGQKRLVQFALAVCGAPALLFLDEPTAGLDVEARATIWRTIRALVAGGSSVVLTTHYLEEAEALADRVAVLAGGRLIASGTVGEIRSVVARKHITCTTSVREEEVRGWTDVVAVTRDAGRLTITVVDAEPVVRRLLAADADLRDLEVRQAGLADAFMQLTKEAA
jgi:ABC-type multidrug transport system ATPase subunit/peptidoglycan/LPS O-acetylase OafA/YrhL